MTIFDSDPPIGGPSFEELNLYNEVVLHSGELAEAMQSYEPVATDRSYRVTDPTIMDALTITDTIRELGRILPDEKPKEVSLHCIIHQNKEVQYGETQIHIDYDGEKFIILTIDGKHFLIADTPIPEQEDAPVSVPIDPRVTSDLIAKLTVPFTAPELCDFTDINDISRMNEICTSLEANDFVDGSIERTYKVLGRYTIIVQTNKEPLVSHQVPVSLEVMEDRGGQTRPLTLTVEFTDYKSAAGLMRVLDQGSEEVTLDVEHMQHFKEILRDLLDEIQPDSVSLEEYEESHPDSLYDDGLAQDSFNTPDTSA